MASCPISIVDMYVMPNKASADSFLDTLHNCPSSVKFTMDVENNSFIPFVGVELINVAPRIETRVYTKPTNTDSSFITKTMSIVDTSAA